MTPIPPIENQVSVTMNNFRSSKFLLAVSGGIDSIVLLHILKKLSIRFEVSHCNFNLRGDESDKDFLFVKTTCLQNDLFFHGKKFETKSYANEKGLSTQMAARELRYAWFKEIMQERNLDYLITAHHKNDQAETILLNIFRGKGNFSWEGMSVSSQKIIRPLLNISKQELITYSRDNKLKWREDSSNEKSDYQRNYLRNEILPGLQTQFPGIEGQLIQFGEINHYNNQILKNYFNNRKKTICSTEGNYFKIDCSLLLEEEQPAMLLFQFIHQYGFNLPQCYQIIDASNKSGKKFYSKDYIALTDRNFILIRKSAVKNSSTVKLNVVDKEVVFEKYKFSCSIVPNKNIELKTNLKYIALINGNLIKDALEIRTYREGDFFYPLGMNNKKLISDFFIDEKVNEFEKKEIPLVCYNNEIVWIAGYRLDNRYKVTPDTSEVLRIELSAIS